MSDTEWRDPATYGKALAALAPRITSAQAEAAARILATVETAVAA